MNPWLETIGVILVAALGVVLGRCFSRLKGPYWMLGYFPPCALILMLLVARCTDSLAFKYPFYWMTSGRVKFVILAFAATMGLTTPFSRLPRRTEKITVCGLMALVVFWFSVLPFLVPGLIKGRLSTLKTRLDCEGICYQTTGYTCAPAAAVTALRKLGFSATEGEIAILTTASLCWRSQATRFCLPTPHSASNACHMSNSRRCGGSRESFLKRTQPGTTDSQ
jgi:hypothetical protein